MLHLDGGAIQRSDFDSPGRAARLVEQTASAERKSPSSVSLSSFVITSDQMSDIDSDDLKRAVESEYGCIAKFVQSVPVREGIRGQPVWEGVVHIFDLEGHPTANRAYAWSHEEDGKRRSITMLHLPPITSPKEAVRAVIIAGGRA